MNSFFIKIKDLITNSKNAREKADKLQMENEDLKKRNEELQKQNEILQGELARVRTRDMGM